MEEITSKNVLTLPNGATVIEETRPVLLSFTRQQFFEKRTYLNLGNQEYLISPNFNDKVNYCISRYECNDSTSKNLNVQSRVFSYANGEILMCCTKTPYEEEQFYSLWQINGDTPRQLLCADTQIAEEQEDTSYIRFVSVLAKGMSSLDSIMSLIKSDEGDYISLATYIREHLFDYMEYGVLLNLEKALERVDKDLIIKVSGDDFLQLLRYAINETIKNYKKQLQENYSQMDCGNNYQVICEEIDKYNESIIPLNSLLVLIDVMFKQSSVINNMGTINECLKEFVVNCWFDWNKFKEYMKQRFGSTLEKHKIL